MITLKRILHPIDFSQAETMAMLAWMVRLALSGLFYFHHSDIGAQIMVRRYYLLIAAVGGLLGLTWWLSVPASNADDQVAPAAKEQAEKKPGDKKVAMKTFMRKKLESSQSILEGLALEDFDLIAKGARQLMTTSAAAEFMVVNDPLYKVHTDEFRRIVGKMEKAAKRKQIDGATLAYMDMTMSCVECHKYMRDVLVTQ